MCYTVRRAKQRKNVGHGGDSIMVLCNTGVRKDHMDREVYELMTDVDEGAVHSDRYLVFRPGTAASEEALIHMLA